MMGWFVADARGAAAALAAGLIVAGSIPAAIAAPSVGDQIETLLRADDWRSRTAAATALGRSRDVRARRPLVRALGDQHFAVRASAVRALQRLGDPRAIAPIAERLTDGDPLVRREARRALAAFPVDAARPYFVDVLKRRGDPRGRLVAAQRLAESNAPETVGAMLSVVGGRDAVARFAHDYLLSLPRDRARNIFRRALGHADYRVQKAAILALVELEDGDVTEELVGKLDAQVPEVTLAAAAALRSLSSHVDRAKYFVLARRSDKFRRARALKVLGALGGDDASTLLRTALDDRDVLIRGAAVAGLASMNDVRAIPKLAEMRKLEENARIIELVKGTLAQLKRSAADEARL